MYKFKLAICIAFALILCTGAALADELNILCTSFPCYDFARAVCGENADIRMMIKPGAEVHAFEPTPADIMALADCDLFIYIGGESDAWVEDILDSFGSEAPETLRLFESVEAIASDHAHDHHEREYDEHIWTSPVNAAAMVEAVAARISEINPENADDYEANSAAYTAEINAIDAEICAITENSLRKELVFADRFPFIYLANEYGLAYTSAFASCSAESEPSAKTMMALIEKVASEKIPAVYTIELSNGKTAQTIAEEIGAEILVLHSVQTVSEADFAAGETYVSLMKNNVEALRKGLN